MNYTQERKLSMYWSMLMLLTETEPEILESIPNFSTLFADFQTNFNKINDETGRQMLQRDGIYVDKSIIREELCQLGGVIAGKIGAYAVFVSNNTLKSEVNYTSSGLLKSSEGKCVADCLIINTKGNEYLADLGTYGITETVLATFKDLRVLFQTAIPKPRAGILDKKAATELLRTYFKETSTVLKVMEAQVKVIVDVHPEFYAKFMNTKKLTKPAYRTLAASGKVVDESGAGLAKVKMSCEALGFSRKVSESGNFRLRNMPDGVYNFVFSRPGYQDTETEFVFYNGERYETTVVMVV